MFLSLCSFLLLIISLYMMLGLFTFLMARKPCSFFSSTPSTKFIKMNLLW